ncbi:MAG: hypothetical protein ACKV2T_31305 [Kofleriaceae bacterium]
MTNPWVCIDCGSRQPERGTCRTCSKGDTLDARDERTRELMSDVDLRIRQKAESRARMIGVAIGIGTIGALWLVPGYWSLRGTLYPGIPFYFEQWFFMAVIGLVVSKLLEKRLAKKRFPYLDETQQIVG